MRQLLAIGAVTVLFVGSAVWSTLTDMGKEELRTRLSGIPSLLLRLAARRLPPVGRSDVTTEWNAELNHILAETKGLPLTRLFRGTKYAADLLFRGAPAMAKDIERLGPASTPASTEGPARDRLATWSELFPHGRDIFYEGDDPAAFARQIEARFGFNPAADLAWGVSCRFFCPSEHLDAIYGDETLPLGS